MQIYKFPALHFAICLLPPNICPELLNTPSILQRYKTGPVVFAAEGDIAYVLTFQLHFLYLAAAVVKDGNSALAITGNV